MRFFLLLAALAAGASPLVAQESPRADTLDLAAAIRLARAANPRIAGARADVQAAAARIRPAGALADPALTLGAMNYMLPSLSPSGDPMTMNQVTLMQTVPVNGSLGLRRSVARFDSARTGYRADALTLDVERAVRARYWELYHVDRALEVMERTLGILRDLNTVTTTMYAVGSTVQSDVVRAQVAVTRMQQDLIDMRVQRTGAGAAFNALLGRNAEVPVVLRGSGPHPAGHNALAPVPTPPLPPLDSLLALADSASPDIGAAEAMVQGARRNEALTRRMIWPDLGLGVAYGQRTGQPDMVSAMVTVSLPVFARSRQLRMRDEAGAMRSSAENDLRAMRLEVRAMLVTAHAEAETARRLVESFAQALLPQASASYESALAAYRVGRVDFPSVLDAQMALLSVLHDLHRYEAMYGTAVAEIDRLIGRPFGESPARSQP